MAIVAEPNQTWVAAAPDASVGSADIPELTVILGMVEASVALKRLGSAAADSIPACRPEG